MTARRGLVLIVLVALAFFAVWWNRYVPPTSGGEALLMAPWAANYLPYRDYFYQSPPGILMLVQAITSIAGPHLLATLAFGVILRTLGVCALYGLLLRIARPSYAALAAAAALFVSSTDISNTPFYYNDLGAALVLVGTYLGVRAAEGTRWTNHLVAVAAGALLAFAVAVKQTLIFGSAAASVALLLTVFPRPRAGWAAWLTGLVVGGALATGGVFLWLGQHHLIDAMVFAMRRAPEGKGGIVPSLIRPLSQLSQAPDALFASLAAWIVISIVSAIWIVHHRGKQVAGWLVLLLGTFAALFVSALVAARGARTVTLVVTAIGWWGALTLAALQLIGSARRLGDPVPRTLVALGILSFGVGYSFAVSWPLFESIAFPGVAVVIAAILERPPSRQPVRWVSTVVLLAFATMTVSAYRKATSPHTWGGWVEPPIFSARGQFDQPAFEGIRLSKPSADLYAMTDRIARANSGADDRMYVFPNLPVLYAIANRRPATYALVHWVDTCPDFLGPEDAATLRAHPPKLLVVRQDPVSLVEWEEQVYRGGRRSSVRDVMQALDEIEPQYDKVAVFDEPLSFAPIAFYVRRDALR